MARKNEKNDYFHKNSCMKKTGYAANILQYSPIKKSAFSFLRIIHFCLSVIRFLLSSFDLVSIKL